MKPNAFTWPQALITLLSGVLFGLGLSVATMTQPEIVLGFLHFQDWGLMLVMGGAAGMAMLAYKGFPRWMKKPLLTQHFLTQPAYWNRQTLIGSALFGIGWGMSGVCPGPALAALGTGNTEVLWALVGVVLGGLVHGRASKDA
jgi:uncharacterized membrane protein YedE/YeeE